MRESKEKTVTYPVSKIGDTVMDHGAFTGQHVFLIELGGEDPELMTVADIGAKVNQRNGSVAVVCGRIVNQLPLFDLLREFHFQGVDVQVIHDGDYPVDSQRRPFIEKPDFTTLILSGDVSDISATAIREADEILLPVDNQDDLTTILEQLAVVIVDCRLEFSVRETLVSVGIRGGASCPPDWLTVDIIEKLTPWMMPLSFSFYAGEEGVRSPLFVDSWKAVDSG